MKVTDRLNDDAEMLAEIIGWDATVKLVLKFGGVGFHIPKISGVIMKELHENGKTIQQIAQESGLSCQQVEKKIKSAENQSTNDAFSDTCTIIADTIGRDEVIKLSLAFGGSSFYVPKPTRAIIREVYTKTDLHMIQIAGLCRCSIRTVYRAIKGLSPKTTPTGKTDPPGWMVF